MQELKKDRGSHVVLLDGNLVRKVAFREPLKVNGTAVGRSAEELIDREVRALQMLQGVDGIQRFVGRDSPTSFLSQYIDGTSLFSYSGKLPSSYFDELVGIIAECEKRGVYRLGINRADFLVINGNGPAIVDFGNVIFSDDRGALLPGLLKALELYNRLRVYDLKRDYVRPKVAVPAKI